MGRSRNNMKMIVYLFYCTSLLIQIDSAPRWGWGSFGLIKSITRKGCNEGHCVEKWKCEKISKAEFSLSECANQNEVCCINSTEPSINSKEILPSQSSYSVLPLESMQESKLLSDRNEIKNATTSFEEEFVTIADVLSNETSAEIVSHSHYSNSYYHRRKSSSHSPAEGWNTHSSELQIYKPRQKYFRNENSASRENKWNKATSWAPNTESRRKSTISPMRQTTGTRTKFLNKKSTTQSWITKKSSWNTSTKTTKPFGSHITSRNSPRTTKPRNKISDSTQSLTVRTTARNSFTERTTSYNWKSTESWINSRIPTARASIISTTKQKSSTQKLPSTPEEKFTTPIPDINSRICGFRDISTGDKTNDEVFPETRLESRRSFQRIVGGQEAEPFSWPWVAAIYKVTSSGGNRFLCAGSLINEFFVLTAAHVFTPDHLRTSSYVVMLGTHNGKEAVAEYMVANVLQHPWYQPRYYYNDIAILRLESPVIFNDYVVPVCLPTPSTPFFRDNDLVGKEVTVMGWGDDAFGGVTSRVLREASFPILSRKSCNDSYFQVVSNRLPKGITHEMLCAASPKGGIDACQGDSGGPLTTIEGGRYTQVGIVSFGYKCGDKDYPGVYTKVSPFLGWIADNARCEDYFYDYPRTYE